MNRIALAVRAVYEAKAEGSQSSSGGAVHPAVVDATHKRLGKRGKDSVAAKSDPLSTLKGLAKQEGELCVGMFKIMGQRADIWAQVGKIGQSDPKVFTLYPKLLTNDLLMKAGLHADMLNEPRDSWPEAIRNLYSKVLSVRVSEARRVMNAFQKHHTDTLHILEGKGTIQQKLLQMPDTGTGKGRKKGSGSTSTTGNGASSTAPETRDITERTKEQQAQAAGAVLSHLANANADGILQILQGCTSVAKRTKEYQDKTSAFRVLIDKLEKDLAIHDAAQEGSKGREYKQA